MSTETNTTLTESTDAGIEACPAAAAQEPKAKTNRFPRLQAFARNLFSTKNIAIMGTMSAISVVLYMFAKFNLPIFPSFLDMQFSDLPILLTGFMVNPVGAVIVALVRFLIKLPFSTTSYVGELGDLVLGLSFALPASIIYFKNKTKKSAIIGLVAGVLTSTAMAVLFNIFILVPFYVQLSFKGSWAPLLNALNGLYAFTTVTTENFFFYFTFLAVIPFNLLRLILCAVFTFFVYKSLSRAVSSLFKEKSQRKKSAE